MTGVQTCALPISTADGTSLGKHVIAVQAPVRLLLVTSNFLGTDVVSTAALSVQGLARIQEPHSDPGARDIGGAAPKSGCLGSSRGKVVLGVDVRAFLSVRLPRGALSDLLLNSEPPNEELIPPREETTTFALSNLDTISFSAGLAPSAVIASSKPADLLAQKRTTGVRPDLAGFMAPSFQP